jgi:hypothetical protein
MAQSSTTTYQTGINGQRVAVSTQDQSAAGSRTQRMQSVDGRSIPMEQTTENILRNDSGGKIVERIIQTYDANGRPGQIQKILIEETPLPGGGKISKETKSQSDLNGRFSPVERLTTETRVSGQTTTTNITLDRPATNNSFQPAEKRNIVTVGPAGSQQSTEVVERADVAGRFRPVIRNESSTQVAGAKTTANTATYELNMLGKFVLAKQTVATTVTSPTGTVTETNVFATATLGQSVSDSTPLKLQQQLTKETKIASNGSVTEVVSVRLANPTDPTKLSSPSTISETVCTGKCLPTPAAPVATAATPAAQKPVPAKPKP